MRIETIGNATLYLGDCREILPDLVKMDALVTDPPYGIGKLMKGGSWAISSGYCEMDKWDNEAPQELIDAAIEKATHSIVWGGNYFKLTPMRGWLSWSKLGSAPKMSDCELAWTNIDMVAREFRFHIEQGFLRAEKDRHPTQKPLSLMQWCINFVPNAKTILDPFMGSGTTGVAAVKMGKVFTGIEREPKYFDIACRRIEEATKQGDMFGYDTANVMVRGAPLTEL